MTVQIKGKYVLEHFLGRGGMAEVFAGRKLGAEGVTRRVAIKRIRPDYCHDDRFRAMFVTEARLNARLGHDNIVSILDFEEDEAGGLFLVMELVDGIDLNALLRTGSLPLPVALFVASEVLQGLAYAHDLPAGDDGVRGLVHRDVSPQNVLLSWDGAVKVSDFGIAKPRDATFATESTRAKGKLGYLSPEYANGLELDGRSDLFAAGVVLWEMLAGEPLFSRASEAATLRSLLFEPYPSPRSRRPEIPADIEQVTMRLLAQCRDARYFNARTAIAALKDCAAFTKHGRELLSSLLLERFSERIPGRSGGPTTRREPAAPPVAAPAVRPGGGSRVDPREATEARVVRARGSQWLLGPAVVAMAAIATIVALHGAGSGGAIRPSPSTTPPPLPAPAAVGPPPSAPPPVSPAPGRAPPAPLRDSREAVTTRGTAQAPTAQPPTTQLPSRPIDGTSTRHVDRRPRSTPMPASTSANRMIVIDLGGPLNE